MNNNGDYGKSTWGERGYDFKFKDKETADKAYQRYKKLYDQRQDAMEKRGENMYESRWNRDEFMAHYAEQINDERNKYKEDYYKHRTHDVVKDLVSQQTYMVSYGAAKGMLKIMEEAVPPWAEAPRVSIKEARTMKFLNNKEYFDSLDEETRKSIWDYLKERYHGYKDLNKLSPAQAALLIAQEYFGS